MNIILASTSTIYGSGYLEYLKKEIIELYKEIDEIIFIPYARPGGISHDEYTAKAQSFFETINIRAKGLHEFDNPIEAIKNAQGFFTGGGNTFVLVKQLHENNLMQVLKEEVLKGKSYLGCSAGSNIGGINMQTTNDMPIVYPSSFETMGLVPFNINPHFTDADAQSKHMGETRETRIKEFLSFNNIPVVGLREGSWIRIIDKRISLEGNLSAKIFKKDEEPYELRHNNEILF
ncbi:dipeptidase E [Arachidicoccus ginsenosidimutans]|uniref:dipeptidase PepE n=1 Tax=Arachidicoccus sp. BS20 TaxID=1850526 RepID=UPI0007F092D9|nr:dipeptidase PepE [Arachidicoccus sp. BS20]ANI87981.1 dipeptidase E [Arachidicoccus sp. BS20]